MSEKPRPVLPRAVLVSVAIAGLLSFLVVAAGCDNVIFISGGSDSSSPSNPSEEGELEFDFEIGDRKPLDVTLSATAADSGDTLQPETEIEEGAGLTLSVAVDGSDSNQSDYEYRWYIDSALEEDKTEAEITVFPERGPVTITVLVMGEEVIGSDALRFRVVP